VRPRSDLRRRLTTPFTSLPVFTTLECEHPIAE